MRTASLRLVDGWRPAARVESVSLEGRRIAIDWSRWRQGGEVITPLSDPIHLRDLQG